MNRTARTLLITVILVMSIIFLLNLMNPAAFNMGAGRPTELNVGTLISNAKEGKIAKAEWRQTEITGEFADGKKFYAKVPDVNSSGGLEVQKVLNDYKVTWSILDPPISQGVIAFLSMLIVPALLIFALWFFVFRSAQMGGNQAMSFGRSRAKRVGETGPKITFEDVAGIDEAKAELSEIVDFLKNTKKYVALGAKIPKGILLTGPPGVGKTYLARAIAGEAGVPFFHISGSDFVEMFVGVGAARVRDLFETAKAHRPCLIFVDEIDAVGRQRGAGLGGGHDEREQTLNQLLVEMDGFDPNSGVIMIAATNRPDVLDPALLRPGRFDRQIVVDAPDSNGREAILKIHSKGKPFSTDVDMQIIAKRTPGFTGADLANSLNEAALLAARRNRSRIAMEDIEEALDRVMVGPARKSRVMVAKERELTAYHEAGHAIVGEVLEHCDPIHKVTILPRGMALGVTWSLPETEKFSKSRSELTDDITMSLGGLVAEELVYGERWTGASSDLVRVTRIARAMVCEFGMSDKLGTLAIGRRSRNPFLGRDYVEDRDYSEDVARVIDEEVRHIVDSCRQKAHEILVQNREKLDIVVAALLERETLSREEFLAIIEGREMPPIPVRSDNKAEDDGASESVDEKGTHRVPPPRFEPGPA